MEIGISTASLYPTLLEDALAQLIEQQVRWRSCFSIPSASFPRRCGRR